MTEQAVKPAGRTLKNRGTVSQKIRYVKRNYDLYFLAIPALIYILIFNYLPLGGIAIAFQDYNMFAADSPIQSIFASPWVGLKHFAKLFASRDFMQVFSNTLIISFLKIVFIFPLPILLAMLLNEIGSLYFKRGLQTIVYLPHFLSWAVVSGIFVSLLGSTGIVNGAIKALGGEPVMFLVNKSWFRAVLVLTDAWKEVGWGSIIYLAAITSVDPSLYEAAMIDGAGKFRQMWNITIPSIVPTIVMMLILRISRVLDAGFEQIFIMYNPSVYDVADIIGTYVYREGLGRMNFSFGTAVGLFNSVVAFVLVVGSNFFSRRVTGKSIW
jgi:putative aldouronate transport system permease protein